MRKKEKILLLLLVLTIAVIGIGCEKKQIISGEQMIYAQIEFSEGFLIIMDEMADTYSEYISYNISEQKFKEEVEGYLKRIVYEEEKYQQFNKKYALDPENTDMKVKTAISCIEEARLTVKNILEKSVYKGRALPREELVELYIEGSDNIQEKLDEFAELVESM